MAGKVGDLCGISRRKAFQSVTFCVKKERNASFKKVTSILQKPETDRTDEEKEVLFTCADLVKEVNQRIEKRKKVKDRLLEVQDPEEVLEEKCRILAEALANSRHLVVYTGAGISTSACIPDYRGTNGIWTLLQQGKDIGLHDLTRAEPTRTHMALSELHRARILRHVVSQNCDGLHLRSGLPRFALSEVHGNMYIEVCRGCKREYWRLFDVTENTARYSHRTMRRCYRCSKPLQDTIVHFGERGTLQWPLNWPGAGQGADRADVILCIGSSLKVLKKYPWLWGMDKPVKKRPKLYIINLQWTPKDDHAVLKISGKCDEVMERVMSHLKLAIPRYDRDRDPIFSHATVLDALEEHTRSQPDLRRPSVVPCPETSDVDGIKTEAENRAPSTGRLQSPVEVKTQPHPVGVLEELLSNKSETVDEKPEGGFHPVDDKPDPPGMETESDGGGGTPPSCQSFPFWNDHNYSKRSPLPTKRPMNSASAVSAREGPGRSTRSNRSATCRFCERNHATQQCLYYARHEAGFAATENGLDAICECCDCDDDDEEEEGGDDAPPPPAKEEKPEANVNKVPIVNPGWYGKGYRKRVKKKR